MVGLRNPPLVVAMPSSIWVFLLSPSKNSFADRFGPEMRSEQAHVMQANNAQLPAEPPCWQPLRPTPDNSDMITSECLETHRQSLHRT